MRIPSILFGGLQALMEGAVHAGTHNAIGGEMAGPASPSDPLFWLHHAFIDKTWADWQTTSRNTNPHLDDKVIFGVAVEQLLPVTVLGYSYV